MIQNLTSDMPHILKYPTIIFIFCSGQVKKRMGRDSLLWRTNYGNISNVPYPHHCSHFTKKVILMTVLFIWFRGVIFCVPTWKERQLQLSRERRCKGFVLCDTLSLQPAAASSPFIPRLDPYWPSQLCWSPQQRLAELHNDSYKSILRAGLRCQTHLTIYDWAGLETELLINESNNPHSPSAIY